MAESNFEQKLINVIQQINVAVSNIRIYFGDHPEVTKRIDLAFGEIGRFLKVRPKLTLMVYNNRLVVDKKPLFSDSPHLAQFINLLTERGIDYVIFQAGLTRKEFIELLAGLAKSEPIPGQKGKALLWGKIKTGLEMDGGEDLGQTGQIETVEMALPFGNQVKAVVDLYDNIKQSAPVHLPTLFDLANVIIGSIKSDQFSFKALASIRNMDDYTFTHVIDVCILTVSLAQSFGFSGKHLHEIGIASLLHDVGKLQVPEAILNKTGKLTTEERKIIQHHPIWGAMKIQKIKGIPKIAIVGALEHHIHYEGGGYPQLSDGYKPSIVSQMIAIADTYDALRSNRPYQASKSTEMAVDILTKEKGTIFNPELVDLFIRLTA